MTVADRVLLACEVASLRALAVAAARSRATGRSNGRHLDGPRWLLHTRVRLTEDPDQLLAGAWDCLTAVGVPAAVIAATDAYVRDLIADAAPPSDARLRQYIEVACDTAAAR